MKTIILFGVILLSACSHTPNEHREERIEGVFHDHEIWEDPKTHLKWTRVPLLQKKFSQAEKVCAQSEKFEEKLERYDLGIADKWRMPGPADIIEAKKRGLRHAFNARHFWIKGAFVYDSVADKFNKVDFNKDGFDVLCVAQR